MGFKKIAEFKAKTAELLAKMKETQLDASIKDKDTKLKAIEAEKAAVDKALAKELAGNKPQFIGDSFEFKSKAEGDIKPAPPQFSE